MANPPTTSATVYGILKRLVTSAITEAAISSHSRNSMMEAGDKDVFVLGSAPLRGSGLLAG